MEHKGHMPRSRIVPMPRQGLAIQLYLLGQLFNTLVEQVCEHICTDLSGAGKGIRTPSSGYPDRQFFLYWGWVDAHFDVTSISTSGTDRFTAPESLYHLDTLVHLLVAIGVTLRKEDKIVGMPTRR